MTTQELLCKIKNLEKIEPDQAWIRSNKAFIFDYIEAREMKENQPFSFFSMISDMNEKIASLTYGLRHRTLSPAFSVMAILFLASGTAVVGSQGALPGDALYPVKILAEKAEVALTFNDEKRATLNFELAEKRLNELSRLTDENAISGKENDPAVSMAMENFKNNLDNAVNELDNIVKKDANADKAVAMAKIANNKTADYAKKIEKTKATLNKNNSASSKDQVAEVISKIEEANMNALTVLASANQQNSDSTDSTEIISSIEEKIKNIEDRLMIIEQKRLAQGSSISADDKNLASKLAEQVKGVLGEAKKDLIGSEAFKALEKVIASNEMTKTAEKLVGVNDSIDIIASDNIEASPTPSPSVSPSVSPTPVPSPKATDGAAKPSYTPKPSVSPAPTATPEPSVSASPAPTPTPKDDVTTPAPSATIVPSDDGGVRL